MVAEFNSIQIITNNRVTAMKGSTVHKSKHQKCLDRIPGS